MPRLYKYPLLGLWLLALHGCKPQQLIASTAHSQEQMLTRQDSIYVHDSIYIHEYTRGDTCYLTEYRDRWRERVVQVHDTTTIDNSRTETKILKERFIPP